MSVYDSMMRHLTAWRMGEDFDEESGLHHMVHAGWACDTLLHFHYVDGGNDDREGYKYMLTDDVKLTDMFIPQVEDPIVTGELKKVKLKDGEYHYKVIFPTKKGDFVTRIYIDGEEIYTGMSLWVDDKTGNTKLRISLKAELENPVFTAQVGW